MYLRPTKIKKIEHLGKSPQNYENEHIGKNNFEQKSIKIDDFNEAEEKEVKERVEKRQIKRREVAEKKQTAKKKKKERKK